MQRMKQQFPIFCYTIIFFCFLLLTRLSRFRDGSKVGVGEGIQTTYYFLSQFHTNATPRPPPKKENADREGPSNKPNNEQTNEQV